MPTASLTVVLETATLREHGPADVDRAVRGALAALAAQRDAALEIIVVRGRPDVPEAAIAAVPGARLLDVPGASYVEMKWQGAQAATTGAVAFVDSDCIPEPTWAAGAVAGLAAADACVGRTRYQAPGWRPLVAEVFDFGFVDGGPGRPAKGLLFNNMAVRRDVLMDVMIDVRFRRSGGCGALYESLVAAGRRVAYCPQMTIRHHDDWRGRGWVMKRVRNGANVAKQQRLADRANAARPAATAAKRLAYDGYRLVRWPQPDLPRSMTPVLLGAAVVGRSIEAAAGVVAAVRPEKLEMFG